MERRMASSGKEGVRLSLGVRLVECNVRAVSPNPVSSWEVPVTVWERKGDLHCCPSCSQPPPAAVAAPDRQGSPKCQAGISYVGPALCQSIAGAFL